MCVPRVGTAEVGSFEVGISTTTAAFGTSYAVALPPRPQTGRGSCRCPAPRGALRRSRSDGWSRRASPARCVRRQRGGRCCSPTGARRAFRGLGNIRVGSCVCTLHDGAAADNTVISAVSVTLTCGSVGLPMREEPPFSAARAYRGATARSDVRVPQLPASGLGHSPRRVSARGECPRPV